MVTHYTELIKNNKEWIFSGIYADKAITGTKVDKREEFQRLDSGLHAWQDRYDYCQKPSTICQKYSGHIEICSYAKREKYCCLFWRLRRLTH